MDKRLTVLAWNAHGVLSRKAELRNFLQDRNIDIALISETHLQKSNYFNIPCYTTYRSDRQIPPHHCQRPAGGTAVLVHRRITHHVIPIIPQTPIEHTIIQINYRGENVRIISAYIPPTAKLHMASFQKLLHSGEPTILMGDLNSKHPLWNSRVTNLHGKVLHKYLARNPDTIALGPDVPTFYSFNYRARPDVLDIAVLKNFNHFHELVCIDDLSSDHNPIILTVGTNLAQRLPPKKEVKRVDWRKYAEHLLRISPKSNADITTSDDVDCQVSQVEGIINTALTSSTYTSSCSRTKAEMPPHILEELAKKRKLRRTWQFTRSPTIKKQLNAQILLVKALLETHAVEEWDKFLSTVTTQNGSLWKLNRQLLTPKTPNNPLHGYNGLVYSHTDKAETFADSLQDQFTPNPHIYVDDHVEHVENYLEEYLSCPIGPLPDPFTCDQVAKTIHRLHPRKSPGLDNVGNTALKNLPSPMVRTITHIFNGIMRTGHFPSSWKRAKIIMILKPRKSALFPQNFRPISLLPSLSKVFERLVNKQLTYILHDTIRPEQFGFRSEHSTTLQLVNVINSLADGFNKHAHTIAVFLDISKAFDKVWHEGLLYKLAHSPLPPCYVHLIRSYLDNRWFQVSVEGTLSTPRPIEAGVPQGSVLGPLLYLMYTNDIPLHNTVKLRLFADDSMFYYQTLNLEYGASIIQRQLDTLEPWLMKWRVAVNTDKTEAIRFTQTRTTPKTHLSLNNSPIAWKKQVRYLGVTLDSRLKFNAHVKQIIGRARYTRSKLYPVICGTSPLKISTRLSMYKTYIRPITAYAAPAWYSLLSASGKRRLDSFQNSVLRSISNSPWYVRNATIYQGLKVPTFEEFVIKLTKTLTLRAESSHHEHLSSIVTDPAPPQYRRKRPLSLVVDPP